ncbi:transglutaminase-like domain-containing protein [Streptantibioticus parmotrematis]|uniref:transglutaminase-like domain-containing protein n=1 Tax=Streptantibioticus parmotrematis TaxID=2873249 RepID=UPI0033E18513
MTDVEETAVRLRFAAEARSERPDLATLCLLVCTRADPAFDEKAREDTLRALDRLADRVGARLPSSGGEPSPQEWAAAFADVLGTRCGLHGRASDYERLESSLLHAVLRRRRGLPILLSVVWTEVGRRLGAPVYGVALPGHFVVGVGDPHGRYVLADPFHGGVPVSGDDAERLAGGPVPPRALEPAAPLDVIGRVLGNIRTWAAARPEQTAVGLWATDLALLLPRHPARLRLERAQLLVQRGDFLAGADGLDAYAELIEAVDPEAAGKIRHQARATRALLN